MITKTLEQISTQLQHQSSELHFIKASVNNLKLVLVAQEGQNLRGTALWTGAVIEELQDRVRVLEVSIKELTKQQEESYKEMLSVK